MRATVTVYDDNNTPQGTYEITPSIQYNHGISTTYEFNFEYCELNRTYEQIELKTQNEMLENTCEKCDYAGIITGPNSVLCTKRDEIHFKFGHCSEFKVKVMHHDSL